MPNQLQSVFGRNFAILGEKRFSRFAVVPYEPKLVFDFPSTYYRTGGVDRASLSDAMTFARAGSATYVDATGTIQTAAANVPRVGHHVWDGSAWVNEGLLLESEARTNFLRNSTMQGASDGVLSGAGSLPTNWAILGMAASDVTITTGSQYGLNYIDVRYSGTPTSAPALRFEAPAQISAVQGDVLTSSVWLNFVAGSSTNLSDFRLQHIEFSSSGYVGLTQGVGIDLPTSFERYSFTGTVSQATTASVYPQMVLPWTSGAIDITLRIYGPQMELAPTPSSYIPTSGATATRAAETLTIPAANLPYSATAMSIAMEGEMDGANSTFVSWQEDADNLIGLTSGASNFSFTQEAATVVDTVTGGSYTSGLNVPFSIASRHGATFINGAVSGTALTANTTPTALPDLSATDLQLGSTFMGTIRTFRMWGQDLGDTGIAGASA